MSKQDKILKKSFFSSLGTWVSVTFQYFSTSNVQSNALSSGVGHRGSGLRSPLRARGLPSPGSPSLGAGVTVWCLVPKRGGRGSSRKVQLCGPQGTIHGDSHSSHPIPLPTSPLPPPHTAELLQGGGWPPGPHLFLPKRGRLDKSPLSWASPEETENAFKGKSSKRNQGWLWQTFPE